MVSRKYACDYRIEYVPGRGGRVKPVFEYIGNLYGFIAPEEEMAKTRREFSVLTASIWVMFIAPLIPFSAAAKSYFAVIPHTLMFIPLLPMTGAVWNLMTVRQPMTREMSEKIYDRAAGASLFLLFFSAASLAGCIIALIDPPVGLRPFGDGLFCVCTVLMFVCSLMLFKRRGRVKTHIVKSREDPQQR